MPDCPETRRPRGAKPDFSKEKPPSCKEKGPFSRERKGPAPADSAFACPIAPKRVASVKRIPIFRWKNPLPVKKRGPFPAKERVPPPRIPPFHARLPRNASAAGSETGSFEVKTPFL